MDEILKDERFAHIPRDPAFKRIPKKDRKIKIDKRFQSMFSDKKFKVKVTVDKRGRPVRNTSTENLKRYYALDSSDESEETSSDEESKNSKSKVISEEKSSNKCVIKFEKYKCNLEKNKCGTILKHTKGDISKILKNKVDGCQNYYSNQSSQYKAGRSNIGVQEEEDVDSVFSEETDDALNRVPRSADEKVRSRLQDLSVDYARGEGVLLSDSSSDEESSDNEDEEDEVNHGWGELDGDADHTDESTCRLAVCNMDWDRIQASDLMVLFHSFLPKGGIIFTVTVFPSEFGLQRMKEEDEKGPQEITGVTTIEGSESEEEEDESKRIHKKKKRHDDKDGGMKKQRKKQTNADDDEVKEGEEYQREKLRQYQLKRLRYYYAVIECDSVTTADALYKECDGMEYESSASRLDLRFIPDDTTFDQEPREKCTQLPDMVKYEPQSFITKALQQSKVQLTWDETDPRRLAFNEKINSGNVDKCDDSDLKVYLATSSSEAESFAEEDEEDAKKESASKYRALLESIESQRDAKKEKAMEMEVTWGIDLKSKVKQRLTDGKVEELSPFQKYLQRRKEKKHAKREEQLQKKNKQQQSAEKEADSVSEDDVPSDIDMNDQYFKEEFEKNEFVLTKRKESKDKKNKIKEKNGGESEDERKRKMAELELLLMDEKDNKKHFSLRDILVEDTKSKKKNKKKTGAELHEKNDDFQVNVQDNRFSALYTSHLYNIDPADPHYKKTKGMEALRQEKLNRRDSDEELPTKKQKTEIPEKKKDTELSLLVKNIKRKTQTLKM